MIGWVGLAGVTPVSARSVKPRRCGLGGATAAAEVAGRMLNYIQTTWTEREYAYLAQRAFEQYAERAGSPERRAQAAALAWRYEQTLDLDELHAMLEKFVVGMTAITKRNATTP